MGVLVGKEAPDFSASVVYKNEIKDDFKLSDFKGKYIVLFFYPLDFTFVCPTELHAFNEKLDEFKERGVEVIAASVDSKYSHFAWLNTPVNKGGIQGVAYPIVSDINKTISQDYDVLVEGEGKAYRGLFLIDEKFIVRHQVINDLPLGRSVDEALRMVDALQYHEVHGEVCPANWHKGEKTMKESQAGLEEYFG
ncbi:MAG: redoxin domain-containing protein [Chitinivibrionales bacterium]|nr:redoxin domain-containing protein [Chitinivibrionales bacterium]